MRAEPNRKNQYDDFIVLDDGLGARTILSQNPTGPPANRYGRLLHDPDVEALRNRIHAAPGCLWGVWLGNRMAAVYCDRGYGYIWQEGISGYQQGANRPALELGVNILVYALIQPGGVAESFVDYTGESKALQTASTRRKLP